VFGTKGALEWEHSEPFRLLVTKQGRPTEVLSQGGSYLDLQAKKYCRLPAGHPEGFYEAFANIYEPFLDVISKVFVNEKIVPEDMDFADVEAGLNGVRFINACLKSAENSSTWVTLKE
jgi:predicted dehydrogenase